MTSSSNSCSFDVSESTMLHVDGERLCRKLSCTWTGDASMEGYGFLRVISSSITGDLGTMRGVGFIAGMMSHKEEELYLCGNGRNSSSVVVVAAAAGAARQEEKEEEESATLAFSFLSSKCKGIAPMPRSAVRMHIKSVAAADEPVNTDRRCFEHVAVLNVHDAVLALFCLESDMTASIAAASSHSGQDVVAYVRSELETVKRRDAVARLIDTCGLTDEDLCALICLKMEDPVSITARMNYWLRSPHRDNWKVRSKVGPLFNLIHRAMMKLPIVTVHQNDDAHRLVVSPFVPVELMCPQVNTTTTILFESFTFFSRKPKDSITTTLFCVPEAAAIPSPRVLLNLNVLSMEAVETDIFNPSGVENGIHDLVPLCPTVFDIVERHHVEEQSVIELTLRQNVDRSDRLSDVGKGKRAPLMHTGGPLGDRPPPRPPAPSFVFHVNDTDGPDATTTCAVEYVTPATPPPSHQACWENRVPNVFDVTATVNLRRGMKAHQDPSVVGNLHHGFSTVHAAVLAKNNQAMDRIRSDVDDWRLHNTDRNFTVAHAAAISGYRNVLGCIAVSHPTMLSEVTGDGFSVAQHRARGGATGVCRQFGVSRGSPLGSAYPACPPGHRPAGASGEHAAMRRSRSAPRSQRPCCAECRPCGGGGSKRGRAEVRHEAARAREVPHKYPAFHSWRRP